MGHGVPGERCCSVFHSLYSPSPTRALFFCKTGKWVDEKDYQAKAWYPTAVQSRAARAQSRSGLPLLSKTNVFVGSLFSGQKSDVVEIVKLLAGKVVQTLKAADICLGSYEEAEWKKQDEKRILPMVREKWLYDSVTECEKLPLDDYLMNKGKGKSSGDSPEY